MLELNDFRLAADSKPVDLSFAPGEIGVVLGRNNSGKTNLLREVAGLPSSAQGQVLLDGEVLKALGTGERPVGYVFQAFVNYPHWTVRENIESPMRSSRSSRVRPTRAERDSEVARIAQTLQLTELLDRTPAELSGGQQQRTAIGRALASRARVLLLDEPFVNLDFRLRERLTKELGELLRSTGTTALFASSDARDAFALADSLVLVGSQEVLQSGKPLDVYQEPVSLEAAHLLSEPGANWLVASQEVVQVVRPEHMTLATSNSDPARRKFRLAVEGLETSGSHTFVQGKLVEPVALETSSRWVARLDGMPDLTPHLVRDRSAADTSLGNQDTLLFDVSPLNLLELKSASFGSAVESPGEAPHGSA